VHVLVTADTVGGVWTYTQELVCGMLERGHRVTLVSFGRMPTQAQAIWLHRPNLTYYPTAFPLEWMQDVEAGVEDSARYLERLIQECNPDVLHLNQYRYGTLDCGIPKVVVAHSDVISWWNSVHDDDPPDFAWFAWYKNLVAEGLTGADAVVTPSRWMLDVIGQHYPEPRSARVIYNGRRASAFSSASTKTDCVLSVGRLWDEAKQIRLLLARSHRVPVWVAGSTKHPENGGAASLNTGENVCFYGERDERQLCALYSDSASYAATSRYEPFGLAPLEAALSGCALIANDIPVFRELWGDAALYFRRNDPDALAEAINIIFENTGVRESLAGKARQRALERFSSQRMVAEYEQLYRELRGQGAAA